MRAFCVLFLVYCRLYSENTFQNPSEKSWRLNNDNLHSAIILSFLMLQKTQYAENHNPKSQKKN